MSVTVALASFAGNNSEVGALLTRARGALGGDDSTVHGADLTDRLDLAALRIVDRVELGSRKSYSK